MGYPEREKDYIYIRTCLYAICLIYVLGLISKTCNVAYAEMPWEKSVWMPRTNYTSCPFMEFWLLIMYQLVPGVIIDTYLSLTGNTKRYII